MTMLKTLWAAVLLAGLPFGTAAPALAHTVLLSSDPAPEQSMTSGPQRVRATFNEDLQTTFAAMTVVGPDGNLWSAGDPEIRGPIVSVGMRPSGPSGRYTVNYRVTSGDGHVVTGSWSFTVTVTGTGAPGPAVSAVAGPDSGAAERIPLWPFVIGALAVVGGAGLWALRRQP